MEKKLGKLQLEILKQLITRRQGHLNAYHINHLTVKVLHPEKFFTYYVSDERGKDRVRQSLYRLEKRGLVKRFRSENRTKWSITTKGEDAYYG